MSRKMAVCGSSLRLQIVTDLLLVEVKREKGRYRQAIFSVVTVDTVRFQFHLRRI